MDPLRGRLVLRGVAAAVPGSRPFLTADEAEVEIDVREGLRRSLHVRHVVAEGVRIDLSAPLPASQGTSTGDLTFLSAAEIDHIDVGDLLVRVGIASPVPAERRARGEDREGPADREPPRRHARPAGRPPLRRRRPPRPAPAGGGRKRRALADGGGTARPSRRSTSRATASPRRPGARPTSPPTPRSPSTPRRARRPGRSRPSSGSRGRSGSWRTSAGAAPRSRARSSSTGRT